MGNYQKLVNHDAKRSFPPLCIYNWLLATSRSLAINSPLLEMFVHDKKLCLLPIWHLLLINCFLILSSIDIVPTMHLLHMNPHDRLLCNNDYNILYYDKPYTWGIVRLVHAWRYEVNSCISEHINHHAGLQTWKKTHAKLPRYMYVSAN